jgi:branched-subunit amino acid permease
MTINLNSTKIREFKKYTNFIVKIAVLSMDLLYIYLSILGGQSEKAAKAFFDFIMKENTHMLSAFFRFAAPRRTHFCRTKN